MDNILDEPDQLRQRAAFALSQIFVVADHDFTLTNAQYGMSDYYDMLSNNAFGNYRTLLENVALHPVMGVYLSMVRNEKANPADNIRPDENFAREVLQLFSIGLFELDSRGEIINPSTPTPSYTQNTQIAHSDHALDGLSLTSRLVSTNLLNLYNYTVCEVGSQ